MAPLEHWRGVKGEYPLGVERGSIPLGVERGGDIPLA